MALIWFDGFDLYNDVADIEGVLHPNITGCSNSNAEPWDNGRRGGRCLRLYYSYRYLYYALANNYTTFIFGIAYKRDQGSGGSYSAGEGSIMFRDAGTNQLSFHQVGQEWAAYRNGTVLLGTSSGAGMTISAWRFIEFKFTIDSSSGTVEIRSNGNTVLSLTSQNTQQTANAYFNQIVIYGCNHDLTTYIDDMYFCDTTGSKCNDFLGDIRCDVIRPDGAGSYTQLTPLSGANYENVDETYMHDGDTTYNEGSTPGNKDLYALGSLDVIGAPIHAVKTQITHRKTDAGSKNVKMLVKSGTTEVLGDSTSLSDSYTTQAKLFEDNPDDSASWEEADVNALEVGMQIATTTTSTTSTTTTTV